MTSMRKLVCQFNVYRWAGRMLTDAVDVRRRDRLSGILSRPSPAAGHEILPGRAQSSSPLALANGRTLLCFDFDGTLAPIVTDRNGARMRPRTARLFRDACLVFPCAVISGRSRDDVAPRLGDVAVRYVVGDHGADAGTPRPEFHRQMAGIM
jgi:Trehalose-phosphatase